MSVHEGGRREGGRERGRTVRQSPVLPLAPATDLTAHGCASPALPTPGLSLQETLDCHQECPVHSSTRSPAAAREGCSAGWVRGLGSRPGAVTSSSLSERLGTSHRRASVRPPRGPGTACSHAGCVLCRKSHSCANRQWPMTMTMEGERRRWRSAPALLLSPPRRSQGQEPPPFSEGQARLGQCGDCWWQRLRLSSAPASTLPAFPQSSRCHLLTGWRPPSEKSHPRGVRTQGPLCAQSSPHSLSLIRTQPCPLPHCAGRETEAPSGRQTCPRPPASRWSQDLSKPAEAWALPRAQSHLSGCQADAGVWREEAWPGHTEDAVLWPPLPPCGAQCGPLGSC